MVVFIPEGLSHVPDNIVAKAILSLTSQLLPQENFKPLAESATIQIFIPYFVGFAGSHVLLKRKPAFECNHPFIDRTKLPK